MILITFEYQMPTKKMIETNHVQNVLCEFLCFIFQLF